MTISKHRMDVNPATGAVWTTEEVNEATFGTLKVTADGIIQATADLLDLLRLPEKWDSYNAKRINPACIARAIRFLVEYMDPETPPPHVVPLSDGGVQLEWHAGGIDIEVEIGPRTFGATIEAEGAKDLDLAYWIKEIAKQQKGGPK